MGDWTSTKAQGRVLGKIRSIRAEDLVFVDEAGVNLALIRLYARALRGQRARGRPQKRGQKCIYDWGNCFKGIVASINLLGATDGLTFEAFVIQNLYHHFGKGLVWFGIILQFTRRRDWTRY